MNTAQIPSREDLTPREDGARVVRGIVSRAKGDPVELTPIVVPAPGPGDVIVKIEACGVCHTDLAYRDGDIEDAYPFLLGHEAAGRVIEIGEGVNHVEVGDFVILNWRAVCGECRACRRGEPKYCFNTHNASKKMTLKDGTELTPALGIGAFCDATIVHEGQCTKVNPDSDPAVAGLLGCGVMAGLGAAIHTAGIQRGESIAVIGCGGVGMAAIAGAKLAGATTIIAIDVADSKLEQAKEFGATHVINSKELANGTTGDEDPVVLKVREITGGVGADAVVDAVGLPATYEQAFYARDLAGRVVLVGVPAPDKKLTLPLADVFGRGGALKSSWYGDCLPEHDFPMLMDLQLQGRLPLEKFVSERIALDGVEDAFATMKTGNVLRSVVVL